VKAAPTKVTGAALVWLPVGGADGRCSRRWCQAEMRGLDTAGRCFGCERYCCLQM